MKPLAVYLHIPFCTVKCGYCNFNAYAGLDALVPAYESALLREIAGYGDLLADREITSISFGGGTPGEFPASGIQRVLELIEQYCGQRPTPDGQVVYAGSPDSLYRSADGGKSWNATLYKGSAFAIATSADGAIVAVVSRETEFFRSPDGGTTWPGPK